MGKMIRKSCKIFLASMLILTLAGCSGANAGGSGTGTNDADDGTSAPITLTYGYIDKYSFEDLNSGVQERIVSFNRSQDDYYIEVVKYGEDSYEDGLNALNADISIGKAPDIIAINEVLLRELGEKGVIEDLYPYIDGGEWPQREDFVDNVLPCFEDGGKLCGLTPFFKIRSVIGNPQVIHSEQVTFAQLKKMVGENRDNDEIVVFNGLTGYALFGQCIETSIESFVDMENRSCDFQNEEFRELLEFSAQFEPQTEMGWYGDFFENEIKLLEGKMYLYDGLIGGFHDYTHYRELTGEKGLLVGFPSLEGCSPAMTTNESFLAINSDSEYKDIAWQFICTFLEDGYLTDDDNISRSVGFPVTETGFERLAQKAMSNDVRREGSITNIKGETVSYPCYATTEEEVAYLRQVIGKIEPSEDYSEIEAIIAEEVDNYWDGTKTVEDVMATIQNRAQLYLDEL